METPKTTKGNGMATYLWVGDDYSIVNPPYRRLDKYCFNAPGNWKIKIAGGLSGDSWIATQSTPGAGDSIVIGGEDSDYTAEELPGWIPAKCPLLFGGFSGGGGSGSWSHTSAAAAGNTWSALSNVIINDKGITAYGSVNGSSTFAYLHSINPNIFVGGGITGNILNWCIAKDLPYGSIDASFYTTANSSGFRDPSQTLRLKVANSIVVDQTNPIWKGYTAGFTANADTSHKFAVDFEGVKAYSYQAGIPGNGSVRTILNFNGGRGADLNLRAGSFNAIFLNKTLSITFTDHNAFGHHAANYTTAKYGDVIIDNIIARDIFLAKNDNINIKGGTAARVTIDPSPYRINNNFILTGVDQSVIDHLFFYQDDKPAIVSCDFDPLATYTDLFGITRSAEIPSQYDGSLTINNTIISAIQGNTYYSNQIPNGKEFNRIIRSSANGEKRQTILVGKPNGGTITIPTINVFSGSENSVPDQVELAFMPAAVEFFSSAIVTNLNNRGGYVYSNANIGATASIRIGNATITSYGRIDLSKRNPNFTDWRFGGLSGSIMSGGIIFGDETGRFIGNANTRVWNTQTKGIWQSRGTDTLNPDQIASFTPTSTTP